MNEFEGFNFLRKLKRVEVFWEHLYTGMDITLSCFKMRINFCNSNNLDHMSISEAKWWAGRSGDRTSRDRTSRDRTTSGNLINLQKCSHVAANFNITRMEDNTLRDSVHWNLRQSSSTVAPKAGTAAPTGGRLGEVGSFCRLIFCARLPNSGMHYQTPLQKCGMEREAVLPSSHSQPWTVRRQGAGIQTPEWPPAVLDLLALVDANGPIRKESAVAASQPASQEAENAGAQSPEPSSKQSPICWRKSRPATWHKICRQ